MSAPPPPDAGDPLPLAVAQHIDAVCLRFEEAWKQATGDGRPRLEAFAAGAGGPERAALVRELLRVELFHRRRLGETPQAEDYQPRFPDLDWAQLAPLLAEETAAAPPPVSAGGGRWVGKYRLTRQLGRGGMGVVYEAVDPYLERRVAVKLLPERLAADSQAMRRFVREARAAARLNHPNVVAVYDADEDDGVPYLVMELVPGGSVADRLRAGGPLPWPEATRVLADACRGLAAAHAAGLIHRDLKPANLLWAADGRVKLADFGLAKLAHAPALTGAGCILGTAHYMSPEQCRGEPADERSDLYSLGATYFTLLTGRPPFAGADPMEVMFAICSQPTPDPRATDPNLPEACAAVVRRAMARDPGQRHASAAALLADLDTVAASAGARMGEAAATRAGPRPTTTARHRRAWPWAALVAATALLIGGLGLYFLGRNEPTGVGPGTEGPLPAGADGVPAALAAIDRLKGTYQTDPNEVGQPVVEVNLAGPQVTDDDLALLRGVPTVTQLNLDCPRVTDRGLAHLRELPALCWLALRNTAVTDDGLAQLRDRTRLNWLWLDGTPVSDAGLAHLAGLEQLWTLSLAGSRVRGPGLAHLRGAAGLTTLNLGSSLSRETDFGDDGMASLRHFPQLKTLVLYRAQVSDDGLKQLASLRGLEQLTLTGTRVTDAGVAHVAQLPSLHVLDLADTRAGDEALRHLKRVPRLTQLYLANTQVGDAGLEALRGQRAMQGLYLDGTRVTDQGLAHLKEMTQLERLNLARTQVGDAGLAHLRPLQRLEHLDLRQDQAVSDAGLLPLHNLARLRTIDLHGTAVTEAGLRDLRQALPGVAVQR